MTIRTKFFIGSGFAVTLAAVSIPACSSDAGRTPILDSSAGGSGSASGGNSGVTGGNKASGGAMNSAMGGKASGGTPNNNNTGGKASGGTPNNNSGGAANNNTGGTPNNNSGGAANNNTGGASSGTGGGGNGGPAIGTGKCTAGAAANKTCIDYCAAWGANGVNCLSESTANLFVTDSECMTGCQAFTEAQLCCRMAAIDDGSSVLAADHRVGCEQASGRGCNMPVGDPGEQIAAMPAACGPYLGTPVADPQFPGGCPAP